MWQGTVLSFIENPDTLSHTEPQKHVHFRLLSPKNKANFTLQTLKIRPVYGYYGEWRRTYMYGKSL